MSESQTVDLFVIGGGVNGAGIARDAAGRGLSVILCRRTIWPRAPRPVRASWFTAAYATSNITSSVWCAKR